MDVRAAFAGAAGYVPLILDTRGDDSPSLGVLPKLGTGDYEKLRAHFKFELLHEFGSQIAKPGQRYYRVAAIELKEGPAVLQPQVRGPAPLPWQGDPLEGRLLFNHWPGAGSFPEQVHPPYMGGTHGIGGFTDGGGSIGWGYSQESHIGPEGGPFTVWPSSDPEGWADRIVGADALSKIGWWDNHITPNPIFQVYRVPDIGPGPDTGYALWYVDPDGHVTGVLPFQVDEGVDPGDYGSLVIARDGSPVAYNDFQAPPSL